MNGEEQKRILEKLAVKNGGQSQEFLDRIVIKKAEKAQRGLEEEAEVTRKATEIMGNKGIQDKIHDLYEEISNTIKQEEQSYVKELLDGNSPHKDLVDYYTKNAHKYVRDEKGNYILREEYLMSAVAKQVSAQLVTKARENGNPQTGKDYEE